MRNTRVVKIGNLEIGGNNPIRIKAMLKTPLSDVDKLIEEAVSLAKEGAEAIRLAVKEEKDAEIIHTLKKHTSVPYVADIHFHYKTALKAIEAGFEGIRLNPLNIYKEDEVKEVVAAAKAKGISIRVGINSGGFKTKFKTHQELAEAMAVKCEDYLKILEAMDFFDIMISLKGSDVLSTIAAYRIISKKCNYPLHLGVTATGSLIEAVTKSSVGLGTLLGEGIGDVIRVSLTAPAIEEVKVAKYILSSLDIRKFGPEVISCPTCSRCEVDLINLVDRFKKELKSLKTDKPLRIAIMGCVVNGPGEAAQADIGVAFGKKKAVIFKGDKILKNSKDSDLINDLMGEVERIWT